MEKKYISSKDNQLIKTVSGLKDKKNRKLTGLFIVEGERIVLDTLNSNPNIVEDIFISSDKEYLADKIVGKDLVYIVDKNIFNKLSDTENAQGILCTAIMQNDTEITKLSNHLVILDNLSDPSNTGTIIRTAAALNYDVILLNGVDPYNPKVIRGTMGGFNFINILQAEKSVLTELKANGYIFVCADTKGQNLFNACKKLSKYAIIIGNEAFGVSEEVKKFSDYFFSLPMNNIESLNASVAAGIFMYQLASI